MGLRGFLTVGCLVLSVLIGFVISLDRGSTGQVASPRARPLIGLSLDTLQEARWQRDRDLFVGRAQELGAEVKVQAANSDDARQIADVESLITSGVDVIVMVPHDGEAMAKAVRLAHRASIPVIAYDRLIRNADTDLYVTFDNERVGEAQARYMVEHLELSKQNPARIVRVYGGKTDNNSFMIKAGQDRVVQPAVDAGELVVVHEDWADNWKPVNAKRIVNAAITKHGHDIDAILTSNDGTAGGAIQALLEEGLAGDVLVTGQDADLVACQRIARGTQSMTVYKPVQRLARGAAELAVRMAQGLPIIASHSVYNGRIEVPSVFFDVITVTRENMMATVIEDGFQDYDAVFQ